MTVPAIAGASKRRSSKTARKKPLGRPSTYTAEIAKEICRRLVEPDDDGRRRSLRTICKADDMPGMTTVFQWLAAHEDFAKQYARARESQMDAMAEEILDLSDDATGDTFLDDNGNVRTDHEVVARSRLRVDTRKWLMSKLAPKKYGDKLDLNVSGKLDGMTDEQIEARLARLVAKAMPGDSGADAAAGD